MKFDIVVYHQKCLDGFTGAWVINRFGNNPGAEYIPGDYDGEPPALEIFKDKRVVIVDFSYPEYVLSAIGELAKHVVVLDHHKTARDNLIGFPQFDAGDPTSYMKAVNSPTGQTGHVVTCFDMERSGARLAWDFLRPNENAPNLVLAVEDRDLWRFQLDYTKEINAWLASFPMNWDYWDYCYSELGTSLDRAVIQGSAIMRAEEKSISDLIQNPCIGMFAGYHVPIVNCPGKWASEAGNMIMRQNEQYPFSVTYYIDKQGMARCSLRSLGFDVSEIAKRLGGGGHQRAAGCRIDIADLLDGIVNP